MALFYKDKPVFGFDIGRSSIKVMGIDQQGKKPRVTGYGSITFDPAAMSNGRVVDPEIVIKRAYDLFTRELVGTLTTNRVAVSLPNAHSFSRVLNLPKMDSKDVSTAIRLEAEQSIPVPVEDLYYDYHTTRLLDDGSQEIQLVACQKDIIDSYLGVFEALNLEVALIESNISAVSRMVAHAEAHDVGTLIVDFGSSACDLSVYDENTVRVTGTVDCSGENVTKLIADKLGLSEQQAHSIKTRYGLEKSKKQAEIVDAVAPELNKLINEIKKVIRYYAERSGSDKQIGQIIVLGGGANLPGLSTYITSHTRVPARLCAPWSNLTFGRLQPPHELETTLFTTAGGLSLITPPGASVMINLLPPQIKTERRFGRLNKVVIVYSIAVLALAIICAIIIVFTFQMLNKESLRVTDEITTNQAEISRLEASQKQIDDTAKQLAVIEKLYASEVKFSEIIPQIGSVIPPGAILTSLSLTGSNEEPLQLSFKMKSQELASVIRQNLTNSPLFESADILSVNNDSAGVEAAQVTSEYGYSTTIAVAFEGASAKPKATQ